jgi:1,4-alpha-glucan branching enzyme
VDLTQAIHRDNALHADGRSIGSANIFGQKFLREWSRTLRAIRPTVMLIAEDHTGWDAVTKPPAQGGLGFNARWELAFYHNLIGDSDMAGDRALLLKRAGFGGNEPLQMDGFSGALYGTRYDQVVFHESHDEAGNAGGTARTMVTAVNGAPLVGATRIAAEARSRLCFGLSLLSAGTPMFFMGEEIGAQKRYTFNDFLSNRENILGERAGNGKALFRFYQDLSSLSAADCARFIAITSTSYQWNAQSVISFGGGAVARKSLLWRVSTTPPAASVIEKDLIAIPNAGWKRSSTATPPSIVMGTGNGGATIPQPRPSQRGHPFNGFVLLVKQ